MSDVAFFELLATICALAASVFIFDQYLSRPRPHKLMWTLGLLFYGIAAGAAFAGAANHWTVAEYKLWYYFGGVLTAIYLGLGSFYLLGPRRAANAITAAVVLLSLYAGVRILTFEVPPALAAQLTTSTTAQVTNVSHFPVLPGDLTVVAILMNIPGAAFLFGGALWSAW